MSVTKAPSSLISRYAALWGLEGARPIAETPTGTIYKVIYRTRPAALKLLHNHGVEDEVRGSALLAWYRGAGAAIVYQHDDRAALIEWLDGPPLSSLVDDGKDRTATDILCQIVGQLHLDRPAPVYEFMPLATRFTAIMTTDMHSWPAAGRDLLVRAKLIARDLLASVTHEVPLHGDLHHDNILFSTRSWLAIDPKGLFGDPAYEFANTFLNPLGRTELCANHARIDQLAAAFAARLNYDRARILGFAAAHAALSICWDLRSGGDGKHQLAVLPNLLSAYERASRASVE